MQQPQDRMRERERERNYISPMKLKTLHKDLTLHQNFTHFNYKLILWKRLFQKNW